MGLWGSLNLIDNWGSKQWVDKNNSDATNLSRVVFLADKTNEWLLFSVESFSSQVVPESVSQDGDILSITGSGLVSCQRKEAIDGTHSQKKIISKINIPNSLHLKEKLPLT